MIKYVGYIEDFKDLEYLCWGQAIHILQEIYDNDKEEEFMEHLADYMSTLEEPTLTTINDYISFDWAVIYEILGIEDGVEDYD